MIKIENLFNSYQETGVCEINMLHIKAFWDDKCAIFKLSEWRFERKTKNGRMKVTISEEQAKEIIELLKLVEIPIQHLLGGKHKSRNLAFRKAKHWQKIYKMYLRKCEKLENDLKVYSEQVEYLEQFKTTFYNPKKVPKS